MTLYELLRGPLLWLAFGVFVSGMVTRVALVIATSRRKDEPIYRFNNHRFSYRFCPPNIEGALRDSFFEIRPVPRNESRCWRQPSYMGRLPEASGTAKIRGRCGDTMEMYLRIEGDRILEARFFTDGCGTSVACGLVAAKLATGKEIDEAALIGDDTILEVLNGLPEEECHCAYLAAETLQAAIHDWMVREWVGTKEP